MTPIVVDTSAWIEHLTDTETGKRLARHWPDRPSLIVPTLVQFELAKWARRELSDDEADLVLAQTVKSWIVTLTMPIALAAADIAVQHRLAMADAIIYATALARGANCLTCDRHFAELANVIFVTKSATR